MGWAIDGRSRRLAAGLAALVTLAAAGEARAQASAWEGLEFAEVRLISAQSGVDATGRAALGLHVRLAPHWKIYWRNPGEAGFPPRIDWSASTNLVSAEVAWPAPRSFVEFGDLVTFGYQDEVVLPLTLRAAETGLPIALRATVDYVACEEICVPMKANLALDLPPGAAAPTRYGDLIARFMARVPGAPGPGDPTIESAEVAGAGADRVLRVTALSDTPFAAPELFVEGPEELYFGPSKLDARGPATTAVFRMAVPEGRDGAVLEGVPVSLTLVDGARAIEQTVIAVRGADDAPRLAAFTAILLLAFVGGLILNLMPCVLPVLSIKLMGVIGLGGAERRHVVKRFLAAAAGIVTSFLALAALAVAVKATGQIVGWGIQFQEPLFLVALVVVLTLFACNLWGWFEVRLPAWVGGLGGSGESSDGIAANFASGAFATVLATPCSAPFLGTALGFALARGWAEIFAVFAALGLGMAAPFFAVAAFPGVVTRMPRPGPWMVTLQRFLGLALAATAVWLLTVLAAQAGTAAALAVGALMAVAAAVVWRAAGGGRRRLVTTAGRAVVVALAFAAPGQIGRAGPAAPVDALWQPFDRAAIASLVAGGKTVFVDVTADWCITCRFNKTTVLERDEVARRLAGAQVVAMRADWTLPDDEIAAYLESFGRFGIPFNAVYGPALRRGLALPEILTTKAVLGTLDRAGSALAAAE